MTGFDLTLLQGLVDSHGDSSRHTLAFMPLGEFKWWIYLWFVALHTIIAVIVTELMGRTYGKWLLWFVVNFFLPVIGLIVSLWYHLIVSGSVSGARRQSFWDRFLSGTPVSLFKVFLRESHSAESMTLRSYHPTDLTFRPNGTDPEIDQLLREGYYGEARAHAWKMLEIARELNDQPKMRAYQEYLEIIAEQQAINSGREPNST